MRWPALELARNAREVFTSYLLHQGWHVFHSGAITFNDDTWLVIGDGGQGKTSLLVALMSASGRYVSNERAFVRQTDKGLCVRSFPMPVAIGMGTALQYPALLDLVLHPETCLYPPRRMSQSTLKSTSKSRWAKLPDKLQLMPHELSAAMDCPEANGGGKLNGVLIPALLRDNKLDELDGHATRLDSLESFSTISRNRISTQRDSVYPRTMPLQFDHVMQPDAPVPDVMTTSESLSQLPCVRFSFRASLKNVDKQKQYPDLIRTALTTTTDFSNSSDPEKLRVAGLN